MEAVSAEQPNFELEICVEIRVAGTWYLASPPPSTPSWTDLVLADRSGAGAIGAAWALGVLGGSVGRSGVFVRPRGRPADLSSGVLAIAGDRPASKDVNWIPSAEVDPTLAVGNSGLLPLRRCDAFMGIDRDRATGLPDRPGEGELDPDPEIQDETFCAWVARGGMSTRSAPRSWYSLVNSHGNALLKMEEALRMLESGQISDDDEGLVRRQIGERQSISTRWAHVRCTWSEHLSERIPRVAVLADELRRIGRPQDVRLVVIYARTPTI